MFFVLCDFFWISNLELFFVTIFLENILLIFSYSIYIYIHTYIMIRIAKKYINVGIQVTHPTGSTGMTI